MFRTLFFDPLHNLLVFLAAVIPGHNIALAVIILTIVVRAILSPLQHRVSRTQRRMRELEPDLQRIKDEYKDDKTKQAEKLMALYRAHGINPFAGFVLLLIQIPLLLALFWVFQAGFQFNAAHLYSFITPPPYIDTSFLGLFDVGEASYVLALLTGISQFFQVRLAMPPAPPRSADETPSFTTELTRSMQLQAKYVLPVMIVIFASHLPAAIALYWLTSSLFSIVHELWVKRLANRSLKPVV